MLPIFKDNFIPDYYNKLLNDIVFGHNSNFSWYYLDNISGKDKTNVKEVIFNEDQSGFYHLAFTEDQPTSGIYQVLLPFIENIKNTFDIEINKLIRVRFGMNLKTGIKAAHNAHTDLEIPNFTLLYYLDESDGDTIFYKKENGNLKVDFTNKHKRNQAVLFDGLTYHSSSSPINYPKRTTININFI